MELRPLIAILAGWILLPATLVALAGCGPSDPKDPQTSPYEAGRMVGKAGLPESLNPYSQMDQPFRRSEWQNGYNTGRAEQIIEERDRKFLREVRDRVPPTAP